MSKKRCIIIIDDDDFQETPQPLSQRRIPSTSKSTSTSKRRKKREIIGEQLISRFEEHTSITDARSDGAEGRIASQWARKTRVRNESSTSRRVSRAHPGRFTARWATMPTELWRMVLARLPHQDVMYSLPKVCSKFHAICTDPLFTPWRRCFHKLDKYVFLLPGSDTTPYIENADQTQLAVLRNEYWIRYHGMLRWLTERHRFRAFRHRGELVEFFVSWNPKSGIAQYAPSVTSLPDGPELVDTIGRGLRARGLGEVANSLTTLYRRWQMPRAVSERHSYSILALLFFCVCGSFRQEMMAAYQVACEAMQYEEVSEFIYCALVALKHFLVEEDEETQIGQMHMLPTPYVMPVDRSVRSLIWDLEHTLLWYEQYDWTPAPAQQPRRRSASSKPQTPPLTQEQAKIVQYRPKSDNEVILVLSFAGTGKTSTLVAFAAARKNQLMLYVAFNRAIREESTSKFPHWVDCRTMHSLAFKYVASNFPPLLKKVVNHELSSSVVARTLERLADMPITIRFVLQTLNHFLWSEDDEIGEKHVSKKAKIHYEEKRAEFKAAKKSNKQFDYASPADLVKYAKILWERMINPEDDLVLVPDAYLKLMQLEKNSKKVPYKFILFDEVQDATPAMISIITRQPVVKIFVGDEHQAIYSWRGARNAIQKIQYDTLFRLTKSFRFGLEVAEMSNMILSGFKGEHTPLYGSERTTVVCSSGQNEANARGTTFIGRTNAGLFGKAVELTADPSSSVRLAFCGGSDPINTFLEEIEDAYALYTGRHRRDVKRTSALRPFADWRALVKFVEATEDARLQTLVDVVEKFASRSLDQLVENVRSKLVKDMGGADYILTTVHKAKGLEFDEVVLVDDFIKVYSVRDETEKLDSVWFTESINCLYVAMTRAKKKLTLNRETANLMKYLHGGNRTIYRVLPDSLCGFCGEWGQHFVKMTYNLEGVKCGGSPPASQQVAASSQFLSASQVHSTSQETYESQPGGYRECQAMEENNLECLNCRMKIYAPRGIGNGEERRMSEEGQFVNFVRKLLG
ncbi:uncharacterized protein VTP21DRAFT_1311 [Calcarisporiella thermophila]|uniref:uncharacterized protein n=1 Tax=Calcarisporiella thermophila TaxID=911321 RepID=UPI00374445DB